MTEPKEQTSTDLFLANKKDIDDLRKKTEALMIEDMGLAHKMDTLSESFKRMEEGFSHSRQTGFDTFKGVQKISGQIGEIQQSIKGQGLRMDHHEEKIKNAYDVAKEALEGQRWANRMWIGSIGTAIVLTGIIWSLSKVLGGFNV